MAHNIVGKLWDRNQNAASKDGMFHRGNRQLLEFRNTYSYSLWRKHVPWVEELSSLVRLPVKLQFNEKRTSKQKLEYKIDVDDVLEYTHSPSLPY